MFANRQLLMQLSNILLLFFQLKALTRLHQLKLLGHTLVVEFAKEQDRVHSPCPPSDPEKKKRYVDS